MAGKEFHSTTLEPETQLLFKPLIFDVLLETVDAVVLISDKNGRILRSNIATTHITGYSARETNGSLFSDIFLLEESKSQKAKYFKPLQTKGNFRSQNILKTKNDKLKLISWNHKYFNAAGQEFIISSGIDISWQHEAEIVIKESEQRIKTIIENAPDGVIVLDAKGKITDWNYKAEQIFGWEADEVTGQALYDVLTHGNHDAAQTTALLNALHVATRKHTRRQIEFKALHKTGYEIDVAVNISPTKLNGKYIFIGFLRDVTEQKRANKALEHKTAQLDEAQKIAHIGSWEWDITANKITWTDELHRMFGVSRENFAGSYESYMQVVHPDDREFVNKAIQQSFEHKVPFNFDHRILRSDGSIRSIYSKGNIETDIDGNPVRMTGIAQDVTHFYKTHQTLQFTQFSVDKASDAVFWVQENARFIYVNESACKMFGYSQEELLTMHVYELETSTHGKANWPKFWEELKIRKSALVESSVRRKDGTIFPLEINTSYFQYEGKEIKVSYARDITERKQNEQKIKTANNDLSTFIYRCTHDLKAPLSSILGLVNLAETEVTDPNALEYLVMIKECTAKLNNILLMLIQTMSVRDNKVAATAINFHNSVSEILDSLKFIPDFSTIRIGLHIDAAEFYSDKSLLTCILQNIIENAIKYRNLAKEEPWVKINIQQDKELVYINISDNGVGIETALQDRIFDLFYRGTSEYKGSGLGLYIVKSAVEKLGGIIGVESAPGQGTLFKIELPSNPKPIQ
ncbi:MAG: PAS domain S-box protein [Sphingobacteriales bacterium]|nr:MAG: PAS domain S-box protein [Sphingobacteriales bacterium]